VSKQRSKSEGSASSQTKAYKYPGITAPHSYLLSGARVAIDCQPATEQFCHNSKYSSASLLKPASTSCIETAESSSRPENSLYQDLF
jgi:hypothetical protein